MSYCKRISHGLFKHVSNCQWSPQCTRRLLYVSSHSQVPILVPPHRFPALPVNDKLLDLLILDKTRIRVDAMNPPKEEKSINGITVEEIRKATRGAQIEQAREKLLGTTTSCVSYDKLVGVCEEISGSERSARELAHAMDESGTVVILGGVVILRPEMDPEKLRSQRILADVDAIAKAIERMIQSTMINPKDSKRKELEQLEKEKALIDDRAERLVNVELWCGLGLLAIQTLGFMRLTFWELSWDVMEPVCFYVTSFYFMAGYAFFLRTSRDPSFEGYFESRFASKQKKLMKKHNFDLKRFNKLKLEIGGQLHSRTLEASYNCRHQSHMIDHVQEL